MVCPKSRILAVAILLAALTLGCASTQQYAQVAQAGSAYATAMQELLGATGDIWVESDSVFLLKQKSLLHQQIFIEEILPPTPKDDPKCEKEPTREKAFACYLKKEYAKFRQNDQDNLATIAQLQAHVRLLGEYFDLLQKLATGGYPEKTQKSVQGLLKGISDLGNVLRQNPLLASDQIELAGSFANLAVEFAIRGMLRKALEENGVIRRELATQEKLLARVSHQLKVDLGRTREWQETRLLKQPYLAVGPGVPDPDGWVKNRRLLIGMGETVEQVDKAAGAAKQLRQAYEDLVGGKVSPSTLNNLLADLEKFIALAEAVKRAAGGTK